MTYFFDQDTSSHWYMIPFDMRDNWNKLNIENEDDVYEMFEEVFGQYRLSGGIEHINFLPS